MTSLPPSVLWAVRDDRTLSAHAKLAYLMLWLRRPDIHPSMQTIAGDMGASESTARRAVQELQRAGAVKVIERWTDAGDRDSNGYELEPLGVVSEGHHPPVTGTPPVVSEGHPKTATSSKQVKGENSRASRRARPAVERDDDKIAKVQRAVILRGWVLAELDDERALDTWARFVTDRKTTAPIKDYVKYLTGIFDSFDSLDGVLSNTGERETD